MCSNVLFMFLLAWSVYDTSTLARDIGDEVKANREAIRGNQRYIEEFCRSVHESFREHTKAD